MLMKGKLYCMLTKGRCKKMFDPDVIRTRSLLIWSQTCYRCATESCCVLEPCDGVLDSGVAALAECWLAERQYCAV